MDIRRLFLAGAVFIALLPQHALRAAPRDLAALERDNREVDLPPRAPASPDATDAGADENPFRNVPLDSLSATKERPLFSPTRRPPPSAAPAAADTQPQASPSQPAASVEPDGPPLTLIGTIVGGERPVAVLFNKLTRAVSTAHEGDETLGWRITAVSARSAVAEKEGVAVTLDLPRPGDATGAPGPDAKPPHDQ